MKYYAGHDKPYRERLAGGIVTWDKEDFDKPRISPQLDAALKDFKLLLPGKTVLELGCGTGPVSCELARRGLIVTGIDLAANAVETAVRLSQERGLRIDFRVQDVLTLADSGESFDLVFDGNCLHCIALDEDRAQALKAVRAVMKADAAFVVRTMVYAEGMKFGDNFDYDAEGILWTEVSQTNPLGPVERKGKWYVPNRRIYAVELLEEELVRAGFETLWRHTARPDGPGDPADYQAICKRKKVR